MQKINTILIDDEKSGRETLSWLLNENCQKVNLLAKCDSVAQGLVSFKEHQPELVFLDVQMPDGNGFEFLKQTGHRNYEVIFVTAYEKYSIEAIRHSAIDYLLKPVSVTDLKIAVEKAHLNILEKRKNNRIEKLLEKLDLTSSGISHNKIVLPTLYGFDIVDLSEIIRLESETNYTRFYLTDKRSILVSKTLKDFEQLLLSKGFFRTHRSHIVNLKHIIRYNRNEGAIITMSDQSEVDVARDRKEEFINCITGKNEKG